MRRNYFEVMLSLDKLLVPDDVMAKLRTDYLDERAFHNRKLLGHIKKSARAAEGLLHYLVHVCFLSPQIRYRNAQEVDMVSAHIKRRLLPDSTFFNEFEVLRAEAELKQLENEPSKPLEYIPDFGDVATYGRYLLKT